METPKHVAPPATATEIRQLLGITAEEMAAARRLLRLTAVKNKSQRHSGETQPGFRTSATRKAVRESTAAAAAARSLSPKARGASQPALKTAAPKPTIGALSKKVTANTLTAASEKVTGRAHERATRKPGVHRTGKARARVR